MPIVAFQPHVPILVRNLIKSCIRQRYAECIMHIINTMYMSHFEHYAICMDVCTSDAAFKFTYAYFAKHAHFVKSHYMLIYYVLFRKCIRMQLNFNVHID